MNPAKRKKEGKIDGAKMQKYEAKIPDKMQHKIPRKIRGKIR